MNDELHDVIRSKADQLYRDSPTYLKAGFVEGAEWLASKLPSREEISRALYDIWSNDYLIDEVEYMTPIARNMLADAILELIERKMAA